MRSLWTRSPATAVPARWLRPLADISGQRCCLFVSYVPGNSLPEHAQVHARAWADAGYKVVMVLAADAPERFQQDEALDFCTSILLRKNHGYDFGAWAAALELAPELLEAEMLAITNDSVYGPIGDFPALLNRAAATDADIVGLTDSREKVHHLQSYCLFFKNSALRHPAFQGFWRRVLGGGRERVIHSYEMMLMPRMVAAGLRAKALFPTPDVGSTGNPTLRQWRALLAAGFPFIKAQLLRDNPLGDDLTGWRAMMRDGGYDPDIVDRHLGTRTPPTS